MSDRQFYRIGVACVLMLGICCSASAGVTPFRARAIVKINQLTADRSIDGFGTVFETVSGVAKWPGKPDVPVTGTATVSFSAELIRIETVLIGGGNYPANEYDVQGQAGFILDEPTPVEYRIEGYAAEVPNSFVLAGEREWFGTRVQILPAGRYWLVGGMPWFQAVPHSGTTTSTATLRFVPEPWCCGFAFSVLGLMGRRPVRSHLQRQAKRPLQHRR